MDSQEEIIACASEENGVHKLKIVEERAMATLIQRNKDQK